MLAGETLAISNDDLPEEAAIDREARIHYGVESTVVIPMRPGGQQLIGVLTFETLKRKRQWREEEIKRLRLIADTFAHSLMRKQAEEHLLESKERLDLAAESAEAGLWELDCNTNGFWTNAQARTIFGYGADEVITMERFEQSVHPEDLTAVHQALSSSFNERAKLDIEYRIDSGAGTFSWISSRGRPYFHDDGGPAVIRGFPFCPITSVFLFTVLSI